MRSNINSLAPLSGKRIIYDHLLPPKSILVGSITVNVFHGCFTSSKTSEEN